MEVYRYGFHLPLFWGGGMRIGFDFCKFRKSFRRMHNIQSAVMMSFKLS